MIEKWDSEKDEVERFMLGLQKAGLKYGADFGATQVEAGVSGNLRIDSTASGATPAEEGFWVAGRISRLFPSSKPPALRPSIKPWTHRSLPALGA